MSLGIGLPAGIILGWLVSPARLTLGVALALALAAAGLLFPQAAMSAYTAWNAVAHYLARAIRLLLMGICFYIVFVAVGQKTLSLRLARPTDDESLWSPRGTLAPSAYGRQDSTGVTGSTSHDWRSAYISWAVHSRNLWSITLLPFLILISSLETDQKKARFPASLYTLY
jgi:hypothetical protein